ncbi:MAG: CoA-binding protein [Planctomycetota bacterium]
MRDTHHSTSQQTAGNIDAFLSGGPFAVVGASTNRDKYGNKVLRVYQQNNKAVYPINPRADEIEGLKAYPDLASLPETPHGISIITPPTITEQIVEEAVELGIKHIWMQPGAESVKAVAHACENGVNVVANGSCVLVVLGYRES